MSILFRGEALVDDERYEQEFEDEPIEGYCMSCRQTVEIVKPEPVWTRRGMPATRGECSNCGGVVFRMGRTEAHASLPRPTAVRVATNTRSRLPQNTVYINFADADMPIAEQIAADLDRVGIVSWLHESHPDQVKWAGGVHPALRECTRMVYVLSPAALVVEDVEAAWRFFKDKRKPVVIAQVGAADPPDALRRSPRFDFSSDYKTAFRQMVQALSE